MCHNYNYIYNNTNNNKMCARRYLFRSCFRFEYEFAREGARAIFDYHQCK